MWHSILYVLKRPLRGALLKMATDSEVAGVDDVKKGEEGEEYPPASDFYTLPSKSKIQTIFRLNLDFLYSC